MTVASRSTLDPRAWIAWGGAASLTPLLGRNPWPLLLLLLIVMTVRSVCLPAGGQGASWAVLVRIAVVVAVIGVAFNTLTTRAGDHVLLSIPDWAPLIAGDVTLNAAVYGLLAGLGLVTLVLIAATAGAALDPATVLRLIPNRLLGVAVAGSIALNLVPQTVLAFTEIREAQMARGFRLRSRRDLLPLIVPVISGGIERAIRLAEVLEARGFGTTAQVRADSPLRWLTGVVLAAGTVGAYSAAIGQVQLAIWALGISAGAAAVGAVTGRRAAVGRTRYREVRLQRADWVVILACVGTTLALLMIRNWRSSLFTYEPYPRLELPSASPWPLVALLVLFVPAVVAPAATGHEG